MNKYQEALNNLENFAYHGGEKGNNVKILQELVDRATPIKLQKVRDSKYNYRCVCGVIHRTGTAMEDLRFCPVCGQALDWSDHDSHRKI